MLTKELVTALLRRYHARLEAEEARLNELDSVVGDGEHGVNLRKSYGLVVEKLPEFESLELGDLLRQVGMTLLAAGGGTTSTLYGFGFLKAAEVQASAGQDLPAIAQVFEAVLQTMKDRGKANPGDKTMIDAFQPAVEALRATASSGAPACEAFARAAEAAEAGAQATAGMVGVRGRALYAGERGMGTVDPGAASTALFFATLAEVVNDLNRA